MIAAAILVFHSLGLASSIHAVMRTLTSQGAIASAVSLTPFRTSRCLLVGCLDVSAPLVAWPCRRERQCFVTGILDPRLGNHE